LLKDTFQNSPRTEIKRKGSKNSGSSYSKIEEETSTNASRVGKKIEWALVHLKLPTGNEGGEIKEKIQLNNSEGRRTKIRDSKAVNRGWRRKSPSLYQCKATIEE